MPAEDRFILEIFSLSSNDEIAGGSLHNPETTQWERIINRIIELGIAGVMYERMAENYLTVKPPPEVTRRLKMAAHSLAMNNEFNAIEGIRVLQGLDSIGLDYILLKGFSYMEKIFGNTWARSVSDLDLLVHQADFPLIVDYLLRSGFTYTTPDGSVETIAEIVRFTEFSGEASFIKKIGVMSVNIDLHWSIDAYWEGYPIKNLFPIHEYPWWDAVQYTTLKDTAIRCLSPEMQFIHMVMHFSVHHQYQGMKWFIEICTFIEKFGHSLDWDTIDRIVAAPDCRKALGITVRMATDLIGENLLPAEGGWVRFCPRNSLLPGEYLFYQKCLTGGASSVIRRYLCLVMLPVSTREKWRMLLFILINPEAVLEWRLTGKKYSIWVQPFYLCYRAGNEFLKRIWTGILVKN